MTVAAIESVSVSDAALRLGVSYWRARDMLLRGDLHGGKDGRGRYYVEAKSLELAVRQQTSRPAAPTAVAI